MVTEMRNLSCILRGLENMNLSGVLGSRTIRSHGSTMTKVDAIVAEHPTIGFAKAGSSYEIRGEFSGTGLNPERFRHTVETEYNFEVLKEKVAANRRSSIISGSVERTDEEICGRIRVLA